MVEKIEFRPPVNGGQFKIDFWPHVNESQLVFE